MNIAAKYHVEVYLRGYLRDGETAKLVYACTDFGHNGSWLIMWNASIVEANGYPGTLPTDIMYQCSIPADLVQSVDTRKLDD